jgi:sulfur-oxidizing protein SoxX
MKRGNSNARRVLCLLAMAMSAAALQACATGWGRTVHLPQGDAVQGREAFVDLRCHACHEIQGFGAPTPIAAATRVLLGGQAARVKTYADILTSIANPSHRLARGYPSEDLAVDGVPLMTLIRLNEVMTVQQLVDLAAFLQPEYEVVPPPIRFDDIYPSEDAGVFSQAPRL